MHQRIKSTGRYRSAGRGACTRRIDRSTICRLVRAGPASIYSGFGAVFGDQISNPGEPPGGGEGVCHTLSLSHCVSMCLLDIVLNLVPRRHPRFR